MYEFTEDCFIGIEAIDAEHRHLFRLLNEALKVLQTENISKEITKNMLNALEQYAKEHFAHEEQYMEEIQSVELKRQRREHAEFNTQIAKLEAADLDDENAKKLLEDMLLYMTRWVYHHIIGSDLMIGRLAPSEDTDPFAFTQQYVTGIELIDEEHKKLFAIIRDTDRVIHEEFLHDKFDEITRILAELKDYTVLHFADEEKYMQEIEYEGLEMQQRAHAAFIEQLNEINLEEVDDNQQEYLEELIGFLLNWLSNHILRADKLIPAK